MENQVNGFRELLGQLTVTELHKIRKYWGFRGLTKYKKVDLIDALTQHLEENLPNFLKGLDAQQVTMLEELIGYDGKIDIPIQDIDMDVLRYYREMGYILYVLEGEMVQVTIPDELIQPINDMIKDGHIKQVVKENDRILEATKGMLLYYGAMSFNNLYHRLCEVLGQGVDRDYFKGLVNNYVQYNNFVVKTNDTYHTIDVEFPDEIIIGQAKRPEIDYCPLTFSMVKRAAQFEHIEWNITQQKFMKYLSKEFDLSKKVAEALTLACILDMNNELSPSEQVQFILDEVEVNGFEQVQDLTDKVIELHNHTKQWILKGYSPEEISRKRKNNEISPIIPMQGIAKPSANQKPKKIGRNEPCPCGSGKKYKKCCLA